jgi:hypothetical protein
VPDDLLAAALETAPQQAYVRAWSPIAESPIADA